MKSPKIRIAILTAGLAACAALASGSVYASYFVVDEAQPFGAKVSTGGLAGYYLLGDEKFTGSSETAWKIDGAVYLGDGMVELALPANAQFKAAYFENGTIAEDAWYNALADTYPFASNEDNVQVLYARTYQITFDETEKKISIADKDPAPYADYKDNYFIKVGENDPVVSGTPGDNKGQWLNADFEAPVTVTFVHSTDGYSLDTGVYKNGYEGPVLENDSYQVTESGTYNIYLNQDLEVYFEKQTPVLTGITATIDGNPIELTDIKTGNTNKAEYEITLSAGQTIAFKDDGTDIHFYHWDGEAKDDGIAYTATKTGIHKFYYNTESQMYVDAPAIYTITGNPNWVVNDDAVVFAWACKDGWTDGHWYAASCGERGSGGDDAKELTITFAAPADRTCGLLVRCYPGTTEPDWSASGDVPGKIFNQTNNLPTLNGEGTYASPGWK